MEKTIQNQYENKPKSTMNDMVDDLIHALLAVNRLEARHILFSSRISSLSPMERIETLVVPALDDIGKRWENSGVALTQVYMAGRICEELVEEILPLKDHDENYRPRTAIATLEDYHTLGKRIVISYLRASGFEIRNYGVVKVGQLYKSVITDHIQVLLISVLMLPSALRIKELRRIFNEANYSVRIVVGGAPFRFDPQLWQDVGADAYGQNASDSIGILNRFYEGGK